VCLRPMHESNRVVQTHGSVSMHHNKHLETSGRPVVLRVAESWRSCQLVADGAGAETRGNPPYSFGVAHNAVTNHSIT
jgi:hypothetical protein